MKKDAYLKIILTVIAICLVWICVKDIKVAPNKLYANEELPIVQMVDILGTVSVDVVGISSTAFSLCEPIQVEVTNFPIQWIPEDN